MHELYSCLLLIEIPEINKPNFMAMYPESYDLSKEIPSLSSACIPFEEFSSNSSIYAFNTVSFYCYALYFSLNDKGYSIVILSKRPFAFIFQTFLKEVHDEFSLNNSIFDPFLRFTYVIGLISSWPNLIESDFELTFPSGKKNFQIDSNNMTFFNFDPSLSFTIEECSIIWKSIIVGDPILIKASNSRQASRAVFSALSLISPFLYRDPYIIWLRESDPRFEEILNGEKIKYKIIASSSSILFNSKKFKYIIDVRNPLSESKPSIKLYYQKASQEFLTNILYLINFLLESNPWADYLNLPLDIQNITNVINSSPLKLLKAEDYLKFTELLTFSQWRQQILNRPAWREFILSSNPKDIYYKMKKTELEQVLPIINNSLQSFRTDNHLLAVLKTHKSFLLSNI